MTAGIIKTFIIVGIVFLSFGLVVYRIFISPSVPVVVSQEASTGVPTDIESAGNTILALVEKMRSISIDVAFFESPLFTNLRDTSNPVLPEPQGRPNPFESIGGDSLAIPVSGTRTNTNTANTGGVRALSF